MGELTNRRVLVTGAGGFIGRHLVARLVQERAQIWTLARRPVAGLPPDVRQVTSSLEELQPAVWSEHGAPAFDVVFHLAAYTPKTSASGDDLRRVFRDNLDGTRLLLDSFAAPPTRIVFASTLDVYAPLAGDGLLSEQSPVGPASLYGSSKYFGESYVAHWARLTGASATILRYGHIYGPGEDEYKKLIPETIRRLLAGASPVVYGTGSATRDLLYVGDAVEATVRAAAAEAAPPGPINIVRGESVSVRQIVQTLAELTGFEDPIDYRPNFPDGRHFRFDNSLMLATLGNWPFTPLASGLRQEVESMRSGHG